MRFLFSIILFLLGVLGLEPWLAAKISAKAPRYYPYLQRVTQYREAIGILGLVFGFVAFVMWLDTIAVFAVAPGVVLLGLAHVVLMIALGLIFGLEAVRRNLRDTSSMLFTRLDHFRALSLKWQQPLGAAAMILGLVSFLAQF